MDAITLITEQLSSAREAFEGTVATIKSVDLNKDPGGKALPLGALYAHLVLSEDMTTQQFLQGKVPLSETDFKGKTGISEPMPPMDSNWESAHEAWAKKVQIDFDLLRTYEKAVIASTDAYIKTLTNEELDTEIDLGAWGKKTVAYLLYTFIIGHTNSLAGEISAIKGVHGAKGYAF